MATAPQSPVYSGGNIVGYTTNQAGPGIVQNAGNTPGQTTTGATYSPNGLSPTGTLTANISTPVSSTTKVPPPAVVTSTNAVKDFTNKQQQVNQLNIDAQNHATAKATPPPPAPPAPQTPATKPTTPEQQLSDLLGSFNTETGDITSKENADLTPIQQQQQEVQTTLDTAASRALTQLNQIASGTYPLSPAEQSLLSSTTAIYQSTLQAQQQANTAYTGQMTEAMASLGISTSAPTEAMGMIHAAIDSGNSKMATLDAQMAKSVADMTLAFQKQDYQMVSDAWDSTSKYLEDRISTLQTMQKSVTDLAQQQKSDLQAQTTENMTAIMDSNTISYQEKQQLLAQATLNETVRHDMAQELASDPSSPQSQNKLFQQGVATLKSELSNRSGGLGLQDAKVNQAIHLKNLFDQYKTTKTVQNTGSAGQSLGGSHQETVYNIPKVQYAELAMGLANLISGTNQVSDSAREAILQRTAKGDINGAISYVTGSPQNGSTQKVLQNLKDSIDRQATTAESERQTYVNDLLLRLPPGLSQENVDRLTQSSGLNSYYTPKEQVNNYLKSNPDDAEPAAQLYDAGFSDQDVLDYLNQSK